MGHGVIRADGDDADRLGGVVLPDARQFILHVDHERAVRADEHHERPVLSGDAVERHGRAANRVG